MEGLEGNIVTLTKDTPAKTEMRLSKNTFSEYDTRTTSEMEQERIEAFNKRSDFQIMREVAKAYYNDKVLPHENTDGYRQAYVDYQTWAIQEIKSRCFTPDANISEKGKIILAWAQKRKQPQYNLRKVDTSLSLFANRTIRLMEEYEQDMLISTQQFLTIQ